MTATPIELPATLPDHRPPGATKRRGFLHRQCSERRRLPTGFPRGGAGVALPAQDGWEGESWGQQGLWSRGDMVLVAHGGSGLLTGS